MAIYSNDVRHKATLNLTAIGYVKRFIIVSQLFFSTLLLNVTTVHAYVCVCVWLWDLPESWLTNDFYVISVAMDYGSVFIMITKQTKTSHTNQIVSAAGMKTKLLEQKNDAIKWMLSL